MYPQHIEILHPLQPYPSTPREIADAVGMDVVLEALGFFVNLRTHRCACLLHEGSNPSAFSWRADGVWHCHSCGAGGDRIALVRAVKQCGFIDAVCFLARLAGIDYHHQSPSTAEIAHIKENRERAEAAAWEMYDTLVLLRSEYIDKLNRADVWCAQVGQRLIETTDEEMAEVFWSVLADLAPYQTFFLAGLTYLDKAGTPERIMFALATDKQRREAILRGVCGGV
jgi:hypothetical protein